MVSSFSFKQLQEQAKESGIGEPIPPGRYTVKAIEATAEKTKDGSKDKITVKFSVVSGPHANRKVFNQYVVSPDDNNALAFFFRHMAAFGLGADFFSAEPTMQQVAAALVNQIVDVDVIIDNYGGEDRNKIKNTFPASLDGEVAPPVSDPPFAQAAPEGSVPPPPF